LSFPVRILGLHPHFLFEGLAYLVGFRLYLALRRRSGDPIGDETRTSVIVGAAVGAAAGSKLLHWLDAPGVTLAHARDLAFWTGGKTIVGGLLGGLLGVELTKRLVGESRSTGDLFALPLCAGMAVGRVGCFLTGLADHTHGVATGLPWGVDFGDGVARHPTQLYEILWLGLTALWLARPRSSRRPGDAFRGFLIGYLGFRLALETLKPGPHEYLGLDGIQVACLLGLAYYARDLRRVFLGGEP